jgi:glucose-1-phosphate cytidylyltransferase
MKVVLFCGGLGMRLRDYDENLPKPMVSIGYRPIMWHLMKYYARHGHKEFVLCLGHKGDVIKHYFLNYNEAMSNDFVLLEGGRKVDLLNTDIHDWRITFADTGSRSSIGERLRQVRRYVEDDDIFLANYSDCLTDLDLSAYIQAFRERNVVAGLVTVTPPVSYHYIDAANGVVTGMSDVKSAHLRVNGGFFIFRRGIFDYIREGEDLVDGPFHRLIQDKQLMAYQYDGFWKAMDTFKDKQQFDELLTRGKPPWELNPD